MSTSQDSSRPTLGSSSSASGLLDGPQWSWRCEDEVPVDAEREAGKRGERAGDEIA
ncbi:hypothetical protein EIP91_011522, partial [Steccherinum ochraceum]